MTAVVIDASVVVNAVIGRDAGRLADVLSTSDAHAPELLWPEVLSAVTRLQRAGTMSPRRTADALQLACELPITSHPLRELVPAAYAASLGHSPYDAFYVALAHVLDADLVTADRRLAASANVAVRLLPPIKARGTDGG